MKLTIYSNFLNHHQLPICKEMYKKLGDNFTFVATEPIPEERLKMGYKDMNKDFPFLLYTHDDNKAYERAMKLGEESDVVIIGSASEKFIKKRIKDNKLTFRYSERIFKEGKKKILNPRVFGSIIKTHTRHTFKRLYMLSASAYTPIDYALAGAYIGKCYKWGYFPENRTYLKKELLIKKNNNSVPEILWVGRFLKWKHPEKVINIAQKLVDEKIDFNLKIIGIGELEEYLKSKVKELNLTANVTFMGSMSQEDVRAYMEKANIFVFTSDQNEGWGAVLNEAMNSGCGIVASHAIGSVGYLLNNEKNGLIYQNDDFDELYNSVKKLIVDRSYCNEIGINAYETIDTLWNAKTAASNFLILAQSILNEQEIKITEGPCSKAKIIFERHVLDNNIREK